ncbi:MAG: hypothetical protein LJE89_05215 [Deltaproteobacteria bacterium]|nr:hypothetical protein [Deltaproteobacteria bacterium]
MRVLGRQLPKRRQVQPEAFANTALGLFNFAVYLVRRQIDKARRDIGQQRFEL